MQINDIQVQSHESVSNTGGTIITPQNLLQGHDDHFTPQTQRLKMEMIQTFAL